MSAERVALEDFNSIPAPVDGRGPAPTSSGHSWKPVDLIAFAAEPPQPPSISGLVYPGRRHVFSGEPETCKTWGATVLAVEEIRAAREILYVDFEMGAREQVARLRALGLSDEEIGRFIYLAPSEPMTDAGIAAGVQALLAIVRPSLVVFDSFTPALSIHGHDPNSGVEVERFYRTVVQPFQDCGAAVVLIDHVPKNKDSRGRYSIASERKLGACDVHLGFELVRPFGQGRSGLAKIITHKDRFGHLPRPRAAEFELQSDAETGAVSWQIKPPQQDPSQGSLGFRPTHLMAKVSEFVASAEKPPSRNEVEQGVGGKRDFVRQAVDVLLAEGYLTEQPGPRNSRLLKFEKHYREGQDEAA